jgi:two-component system chemotaxis sensor kinase CheA
MFDLTKFKERFIEEAFGLINQLEGALLDQEDQLENKENVQQIFRVLHTLKGTSAMYGYAHIGDLVHDLESIFDLIREGKQEFTTAIFEITLKIVDHLRNLLNDEPLVDENNKKNQADLLKEIAEIVGIVRQTPQLPHPSTDFETTETVAKKTYYIIFHPTESQLFRCINILQIFSELADLGEYKIVNHAFKDSQQDENAQNAWGIYLVTTQSKDAIEEVFMFVLDDCRILKISDKNLFDHDEFLNHLDSLKELDESAINETLTKDQTSQITVIKQDQTLAETVQNSTQTPHNGTSINEETTNDIKTVEAIRGISDVPKQTLARISIDSSKLDRLMYLVSELVITKSQLNLVVENKDYTRLSIIAEKIDELSRHFRDNALNIRLVPVAEMMVPYKRLMRDLSKDLNKEVKFITKGTDTELDKNVLDRLSEPIMHILRNSLDHGIEKPEVRVAQNKTPYGNIKFNAFYSGANVYIQIEDDGAGIDPEKIRKKAIEKGMISANDNLKEKEIIDLIFHPGFSLAEKVTEVSGRGVGMDVVRKKINELRGEVELTTELGKGTSFTIKLHQTLSIIDTLLIKVADTHYLIPIVDIEFCDMEKHNVLYKNNNRQVELQNEIIPFVSLRDLFNHSNDYPQKENLVVISRNDKRIAIVADKIVGDHQAVLKPLGDVFQSQHFLSGASFLGDGTLALMLDTSKLINKELVGEYL